jgi:molecular chaperone GrpE
MFKNPLKNISTMKKKNKEEALETEVLEKQGESVENADKVNEDLENALEKENAELKDKYIRLIAEFDNFKKRSIKERFDLMKTAAQDTIIALLPVIDDFERAKKVADDENTQEVFSEGVNLVYNKLKNALANKGLKVMETINQPFDPDMHEALTEIPAPSEDMKGKIIETIENGYILNDKIIRYAKVVVGK